MKHLSLVALSTVLCLLIGCQAFENIINPMPTTAGSRVTAKLRDIPPPDPARVKAVTVYRFQNKTGFPHGLAITNGMTDQLITALVKTGHFTVVERSQIGDLSFERGLQGSGEATDTVAGTKLTGADLIFMGAVTEMGETGGANLGISHWGGRVGVRSYSAQVGLDMRITEVATGRVLDSIDVRRTVRKTGMQAGHSWGISGGIQISNALDLAVRETLEEAVYQLVTNYGAHAGARWPATATPAAAQPAPAEPVAAQPAPAQPAVAE